MKKYDPVARKHVEFQEVEDQVDAAVRRRNEKSTALAVLFRLAWPEEIVAGPERVCTRRPLNPFRSRPTLRTQEMRRT